MGAGFENILIIKPSSLGDIVLALPALTALRRSFGQANISWLVRPEFAPLLKNHPHLNDIILFDRKLLGKAWRHRRAIACLLSLVGELRRRRFDAVFDFQGLFRTASLAWVSGCKNRFGMKSAREFAHLFYTHRVAQEADCIHLVDYYLRIVGAAGASALSAEFVLPVEAGAAESMKSKLGGQGVEGENYAVFIPGSAHADKCWPVERFASVADKLRSEFGFSIVAAGTLQEKGVVAHLKKLAHGRIADMTGLTNLPELAALLKSARVVVSNDTGPGHIAGALGTPLVMIFGRSNPARVAPYGRKDCVVGIDPWGRGLERNSRNPKYQITAIEVQQVYQKVLDQLRP
jgi:heptosyltransferase-1